MTPKAAKRMASAAGLDFFYDTQWRSWGLTLPMGMSTNEGSIWMSPGEVRSIDAEIFAARYIAVMVERMNAVTQA